MLLNPIKYFVFNMFHSFSTHLRDIHIIPMFSDNYGYLLIDKSSNSAAIIDPGDAFVFPAVKNKLNVDVKMILNTHKHNDHVGGNLKLLEMYEGVKVYGPKNEPIPGITNTVCAGDVIKLGETEISVIETPCHTSGHISYYIAPSNEECPPILFPGDTLFVGGCGRFFEGTPEQMLSNMDQYAKLPPSTLVFCAHEYTENNYRFLATVDPSLNEKYEQVKSIRAKGLPTIPSTISDELTNNLFMRCRDRSVLDLLNTKKPEHAMKILREMKNNF